MATMIMLTCTHCGKEYYRSIHIVRSNKSKKTFCCREHKWAYDRRHYENFWCSVDKSGGPDACWLWQSTIDGSGYGTIEYKGKVYQAHRRAYELVKGPIPEGSGYHGTVVRHECDVRQCVNPAHLIVGSHQENMKDMVDRKRFVHKLTENQVRAIRVDARSYSKISAEYGLCLATISEIKRRLIWKHIE